MGLLEDAAFVAQGRSQKHHSLSTRPSQCFGILMNTIAKRKNVALSHPLHFLALGRMAQ